MIARAGAQRSAAQPGEIIGSSESSPRGADAPDDRSDTLSQAASPRHVGVGSSLRSVNPG